MRWMLLVSLFLGLCGGANDARAGTKFSEAGIPSAERVWSGADYLTAAKVFKERKVTLPLHKDTDGKLLLERMTAEENLKALRDKKLPLDSRMENFDGLFSGANRLFVLYVDTANKGGDVHQEMTELMAFMLSTAAEGADLIDELMPLLRRDSQYLLRMEGIRKMKGGLTTLFTAAESSLTEKGFLTAEDHSTMLKAMTASLPRLKNIFTPEYRETLKKKLEADKAQFHVESDLSCFTRMLAELK